MNNYENKVAVITGGTPNQEKEWANYNRRVKSHGVKTCVQLGAGAGQNSVVPPFVKALSASEMPLYFKPKKHTIAMSKKQIHDLVAAFGKAAASAKRAGFDAVEIHAHTGYMLDQFISECWNHRTDEYGGSVENRARIVCEIIEEIRRNVGEGFPIILRVSMDHKMPNQRTPEESQELIKVIDKTSVTAYDVDLGCYGSGAWGVTPDYYGDGAFLPAVHTIRAAAPLSSVRRWICVWQATSSPSRSPTRPWNTPSFPRVPSEIICFTATLTIPSAWLCPRFYRLINRSVRTAGRQKTPAFFVRGCRTIFTVSQEVFSSVYLSSFFDFHFNWRVLCTKKPKSLPQTEMRRSRLI